MGRVTGWVDPDAEKVRKDGPGQVKTPAPEPAEKPKPSGKAPRKKTNK